MMTWCGWRHRLAGWCGVLAVLGMIMAAGAAEGQGGPPLPPASPARLPRWRGFNLLEKFHLSRGRQPFREEDFRWISELGFNMVRLPMDYRCWIVDGDWERFDESVLAEIDQAVAWGRTYGIHVMINFHRAPGYCVNKRPPEPLSLWESPEAQRVCALHWRTFAERYRGVPNAQVSFNLVNEPHGVDAETYLRVVEMMAAAIRAEDPERLIVSDSFFGDSSVLGAGLARVQVAFSPHQYWPGQLTHYRASWVNGSEEWREPTWPMVSAPGTLCSPAKTDVPSGPLVLRGAFPAGTRLRLRVNRVSSRALLVVRADDVEVWRREFVPGPGEGEWEEVVYVERWKMYQNVYNRDYELTLPTAAGAIEVETVEGDWLRLSEVGVRPGRAGAEYVLGLDPAWGKEPPRMRFHPDDPEGPFSGGTRIDRETIRQNRIANWQDVEAHGIGVFIGEFGVFNKTPHDVSLRWMEDSLSLLQEAGWGWALWNFRGSFGILDSGREDVTYEDFRGHQLDRTMLELLQRY